MNIQTAYSIRHATQADALPLAKLIDIAGEGIPTWLWRQSCTAGQSPLEVGTQRAQRSQGGFSFRNALVAEKGGEVIGMALGYPIDAALTDNLGELPPPIAPFVDLEMQSVGTWYVNALAIFAGQQSFGVGSGLLQAAEERAGQAGYHKTSIQVFAQNRGAARLYERKGYRVVARSPVQDHPCHPYYSGDVLLLVKDLGHQPAEPN